MELLQLLQYLNQQAQTSEYVTHEQFLNLAKIIDNNMGFLTTKCNFIFWFSFILLIWILILLLIAERKQKKLKKRIKILEKRLDKTTD